jgi:hypothetical protein
MLVSELILDIRDTLADPNGDRWDDPRIIRGINSAQNDICLKANILRNKTFIDVVANKALYNLPDDVMFITRVLNLGEVLPLKSHEEMDDFKDMWEIETSDEITHIVYDKSNMAQIKVYPVPVSDVPAFGTITSGGLDTNFNSAYGIITALQGPLDIYTGTGLVVYYLKKPVQVTEITDSLEINDTWKKAIKHYVSGMLLRDDRDTQNRAFGNEELQLYLVELDEASKAVSRDYTKTTQYNTTYRRF